MSVLDSGLHDVLKALKLTGMLDTLDERLAQARAGGLGHTEVLQLLCEDELARRQSAAMARRITRARFEASQATLEGFDFTSNPKMPTTAIRDLGALRWLTVGESVIFYGPVGVGKTHLAQALGHNAIRRGLDVRFTKTSRLLADLAGGHADRTWDRRLREYTRPAVLILDDFAMRELTTTQADDLYELVSDRSAARKPLIITSNRRPADWYPLFPNPVVAREPPRPAHQQQPPTAPRRAQLPTTPTPTDYRPARRLDTNQHHPVEPDRRPPGELRDRNPWGIT